MSRSRGKRYDAEPKLNIKKVIAVILAIVVIIMFVFVIKGLFSKEDKSGKIVSKNYFSVFKDNKWGVIDASGEYVIDPSYQEMIIVPNSKVAVFLCSYDIDYSTGEYKTKVLNDKNQEIFTDYDKIQAIQNRDDKNNLYYDINNLIVQKGEKYGLVSLSGKEILAVEYDEILPILQVKNSFKVKKDDKYGIVDGDGKVVIDTKYQDVELLGKDNKDGFIVKNDTGLFGIVDYSDKVILENKYESIDKVFSNEMYVVKEGKDKKVIDKDGKDVLIAKFDEIKQISDGQDKVFVFVLNGKYGVMNETGKVLINSEYEYLQNTKAENFISKKDGKFGIINSQCEVKVNYEYDSIEYNKKSDVYIVEDEKYNAKILNGDLEEKLAGILLEFNEDKGYLKIRNEDNIEYYNFKFEQKTENDVFANRTLFLIKQDGKYGYKDKNGNVVVQCEYDDAMEQNDFGYAAVKKDGKWGCVDAKGTLQQEPMYDLENYLLIDFIGRWHLGLDINMNYYNQL